VNDAILIGVQASGWSHILLSVASGNVEKSSMGLQNIQSKRPLGTQEPLLLLSPDIECLKGWIAESCLSVKEWQVC